MDVKSHEEVTTISVSGSTTKAAPINYRGELHTAAKDFVWGTQRAMPPEETLARIRPHFPTVGITRLADITGLDRVGVPIWCSIRPDSSTLAVDSGKGATSVAAATSAAMEALERSVAESFDDVVANATFADVAEVAAFGPHEHPRSRHSLWSEETQHPWSTAWDLVSGHEVLAPSALIRLPGRKRGLRQAWWVPSSNGLASGNNFPEALCAAIYEVIERDATACWQVAIERGHRPLRLDLDSVGRPVIRGLLDQLAAAGLAPALLWCPNEFRIPVFLGYVSDLEVPNVGVYKGYGCHLDPEIAMIRAVTEAVQARTLFIAGARDDLFRSSFRAMRAAGEARVLWSDGIPTAAPAVPDASTDTFHGDVGVLIERLVERGFDRVVVRELPAAHLEVSVVRVFVPGLEGYKFAWIASGERAANFDPSSWIS